MATVQEPAAIDTDKLMSFVFRAVDEVGATLNTALVVMGDKLGLYRALSGSGPLSPAELARRADISERYAPEWLHALTGVVPKLQAGAKVADVGCGHGASTVLMARAFPASTFVGYDYHEGS